MAPPEQSPIHVPLRTSSLNPIRNRSAQCQEDVKIPQRKASKASRILGTDLSVPNEHGRWHEPRKTRPSRTPDSAPKQNTGLVPFPTSTNDARPPHQNLRVRASSPLLGQNYHSHPAPPLSKPSKKIHQSGSSSTLFSYFSSKESSKMNTQNQGLQPQVQHELHAEPQVTFKQPRGPMKESKRKMRPPRIDLSLLFPKPRNTGPPPPLLSPQRMTCSPSPVSTVVPDYPTTKIERPPSPSANRRYTEATSHPHASSTKDDRRQHSRKPDRSNVEARESEWFEHPLERTVGTKEIDLALDRYDGRRSPFSRSSVYTASREQLRTDHPERHWAAEAITSSRRHSPPARQPKDPYLTPTSRKNSVRQRATSSPEEPWRHGEYQQARSVKSNVTKKSSKSTLKNKDLQNSSVLCLSSSEDEEEETPTAEQPRNHKNSNKTAYRESVATYGEYEPQIYTASTAQAAVGPALRRVERAPSTSSHGSHHVPRSSSTRRNPSMSSTGKSSHTTRQTQSRRSSGIPTIAEPTILEQFPRQPLSSPEELKEMNRRSRVIAVTRQEQDLLDAFRKRKGKVTPSLFNYNASRAPTEADRSSMISGPSRDSFCGSETSFLRLSAVLPPNATLPSYQARTNQGATHKDKQGSLSQSSSSDSEQKTGNSVGSPQFSLGYSESLPSPATSGASPLTPTLPIHRFSPLPSPKPPPRNPPPAVPEVRRQHTRRRTDSSEAIMLDENGESRRKHPLWSFDFDWNHDRANVAAVH
ncbi:hypothetical protein NUU61_008276 [Penicillium alfredii]|uniref:Uncharacterized protein n=1 Tax=Penicillium alfredii TaxID=1506179 RepID=A0A9W9JYW6_9EURO|nr:uncharacterized protein NUU61_008276 [Penicillium alfredii]KAJ5086969.1 hypothetical protein NUU61_008276 [Penicillium alfredii]